jgi:RNA polymerase-binding transcription factor DksA
MADEADLAQVEQDKALAAALSLVANRLQEQGPGPEWIDGRPHCIDCGAEIPLKRLEAVPGASRCVT